MTGLGKIAEQGEIAEQGKIAEVGKIAELGETWEKQKEVQTELLQSPQNHHLPPQITHPHRTERLPCSCFSARGLELVLDVLLQEQTLVLLPQNFPSHQYHSKTSVKCLFAPFSAIHSLALYQWYRNWASEPCMSGWVVCFPPPYSQKIPRYHPALLGVAAHCGVESWSYSPMDPHSVSMAAPAIHFPHAQIVYFDLLSLGRRDHCWRVCSRPVVSHSAGLGRSCRIRRGGRQT